jgi:ferredoxin-NADP reductase
MFVHATTKRASHAFREEVLALTEAHPLVQSVIYYKYPAATDESDTITITGGGSLANHSRRYLPSPDAEHYYCGRIGFMNAQSSIWISWTFHFAKHYSEAFAPDPSFDSEG